MNNWMELKRTTSSSKSSQSIIWLCIMYLWWVLHSKRRSQFSGILGSMLISWVGGRQGLHRICDDCPPSRGFDTSCRRSPVDFLVDKGFAGGWRSSSWLECRQLDLSVFLLLYLVWWIRVESVCLVLCCVVWQKVRVDTLCILPLLNALFAAQWEADYERDEEIMRDGKWIHHKPHDMGERGKWPICWLSEVKFFNRSKLEAKKFTGHWKAIALRT